MGQKVLLLNYNITYGERLGSAAQLGYTLYVKVNGTIVKMIANQAVVNSALFSGFPPACTGEYCFYEKSFEVPIDIHSFTEEAPAQVEVHFAGTTSDQSLQDGFMIMGGVHFNFRFVLFQTDYGFKPRDASDAASECQNSLNTPFCYPMFFTEFVPIDLTMPLLSPPYFDVEPTGKVRFRLKFPKAHLPGTSSNQGTGTDPDYTINPLMVSEPGEVSGGQELPYRTDIAPLQADGSYMVEAAPLGSKMLKVTSRDFGGRARLYAEAIYDDNGTEFAIPAEIVDAAYAPAPVPSCLTASTFKFATIPVDQDCDDIADSWEDEVGQIATADQDVEPGPGGPHVGDGYTAHDEYRGFHYIQRAPQAPPIVRWTRTDPNMAKNAFFWDESLYDIYKELGRTLAGANPNLVLLEVDGLQANAFVPRPASQSAPWVGVLAKNSIYPINPKSSFALVFHKQSLATSNWGESQVFKPIGIPILYDGLAIAGDEVSFAVPTGLGLAYLLAHEAGHQFGLSHNFRPECLPSCNFVVYPSVWTSSFGLGDYSLSPTSSAKVFARAKGYTHRNQTFLEDRPIAAFQGQTYYLPTVFPNPVANSASPPNLPNVYEFTFGVQIQPSQHLLRIEMHTPALMDWSFDPRYANDATWKAQPSDLVKICIHGAC